MALTLSRHEPSRKRLAMSDPRELIVPIKAHVDVVLARQKVRGLVSGLRFSGSELTLIATAISEVARNIITYAGSGEIVLRVVQRGQRRGEVVMARDAGPRPPGMWAGTGADSLVRRRPG